MQTRRDQLHAYRFQNRRALAALVTGEPNVLEPPMRRLTATTVSGIMIAVLVAVGAIVVGLIKPSAGDAWKEAGAIIDDRSTGARYVRYPDGVLHPVVNYASAVLIAAGAGSSSAPHLVFVDPGDIADAPRGSRLGVAGLPDSLPGASGLAGLPWTVCSRQQVGATTTSVRVGLTIGAPAATSPTGGALASGQSVYVRAATGGEGYLLYDGHRLRVPSGPVAAALGLSGNPVVVGSAFLDSLPAGPDLDVPVRRLSNIGSPSGTVRVNGRALLNGQTVQVQDNGQRTQYYVVLDDGFAAIDPVELAVFLSLPVGAAQKPVGTATVSETTIVQNRQSSGQLASLQSAVSDWPTQLPHVDPRTQTQRGVCAVFRSGSSATFAVPSGNPATAYLQQAPQESSDSLAGRADTVQIGSGGAALARSSSGAGTTTTTFLVTPTARYAIPDSAVFKAFGYDSVKPVELPSPLLKLVAEGPALDPAAARKPVSG